jgi:phosphate transport system protein
MIVAMNRNYDAELREIRTRLLEMGGEVDLMISNSVKSLVQRDSDLAESVIAFVREINTLGEEIDSHCMHLQAIPALRHRTSIS